VTEDDVKRLRAVLAPWDVHCDDCGTCRRARRLRFAGATPGQIARWACDEGRPLFEAVGREAERVAREEGS
jgi:hypothetical protein